MESLKTYVFDVYGIGMSIKSILVVSNSKENAIQQIFKKHYQGTGLRLTKEFYIDELIIEGEDMCEITELKHETVTFNCKVIRQDIIEVTFKVNQGTRKTIQRIQDKLNIEGKDNLAEIAQYIAEQFQDDVTDFEGIGAIKIDDAESEKDVKGIGIKIINHCDRKTRVMKA